jgi:excisionase family DNA binding protein
MGNPTPTHLAGYRENRANEIRPEVSAYCFDGKTAIPMYISTAEAAALLGITRDTFYHTARRARIRQNARGSYRVNAEDVLRYQRGLVLMKGGKK